MDSLNLPAILTPDFGLLFWMLIAFVLVFALLAKFGFPVITGMVDERKKFIDESLRKAHEAAEKLANIQQESEEINSDGGISLISILSYLDGTVTSPPFRRCIQEQPQFLTSSPKSRWK